jgi:tetratricopeptide (TPR) repeat protein
MAPPYRSKAQLDSEAAVVTPTPGEATPTPAVTPDAAGRLPGPGFNLSPGTELAGRYRIVRFIAAGGMGEVYEARDLMLGTEVALKTIRPAVSAHEVVMERFRREILLARRVTHPNVCRIFDLGHHAASHSGPGVTFLTMELLRGDTLRQHLRTRGPLKEEEALPLVVQMAAGLAAAHEAGVVHRDFKAANVMLVPPGSMETATRVVVTDFGLAQAGDSFSSITRTDHLVGTPAYVAPEQVEGGEVTPATDLYAFGIVLYEMTTGRLPFEGDSPLSTVLKRFREEPVSPRDHRPGLRPRWEAAILRCLERDPRDRFATAHDVVAALRGEAVAPAAKHLARRRVVLAAALGATALTAAGAYLWTRPGVRTGPPPAASPVAEARRAVAVLGLRNLSGSPEQAWLSTALAEMLTAELGAGGRLRTVPGENISRLKADLELPEAESLGADTLARVRSRAGADVVLLGSYLALGEAGAKRLRIDLRVQDTASGETVASLTETGTESEVFDLVSRAGRRLREGLGAGTLSPTEAGSLRASLPATPEAARLYAEGLARLRSFDARAARSLLEEATRADPGYAPAYAALADAWAALGYDSKAAEAARRAHEGAQDLSREERLAIEGRFREATREWPRAVEAYRTLWTTFPDDVEHGLRLASAQIAAGQAQDARATLAAVRKLPTPSSDDPRIDLAEALASEALGDFKSEREQAARAGARASERGIVLLRARARLAEAWALRHVGRPRDATAASREARTLYEAAGDRGGVALSLLFLSNGLEDEGDLPGARRAAEEGLAIRRQIGDDHGMARMLNTLANVLDAQGDTAGARRRREESLALFRRVGNPYGVAVATFNLANIKAKTGDHDGARAGYEEALSGFRQVGNQMGIAAALTGLGNEMKERGQFAAARVHYDEALQKQREIGDVAGQSICHWNLGFMAMLLADLVPAQSHLDDALRLARQAENKGLIATALTGRGELALRQGDLSAARRQHEEALAMRTQMGEVKNAGESRMLLARVALEEGRAREAEAESRALPGVFRKAAAPEYEAHTHAVRARALLALGNVPGAEAEVRQARARSGQVIAPEVRYMVALAEGRVRDAVGDREGAARSLKATADEARGAGLKTYELEARLALGELAVRAGRAESGRALLRAVESEATSRGLGLLARQAATYAR